MKSFFPQSAQGSDRKCTEPNTLLLYIEKHSVARMIGAYNREDGYVIMTSFLSVRLCSGSCYLARAETAVVTRQQLER